MGCTKVFGRIGVFAKKKKKMTQNVRSFVCVFLLYILPVQNTIEFARKKMCQFFFLIATRCDGEPYFFYLYGESIMCF